MRNVIRIAAVLMLSAALILGYYSYLQSRIERKENTEAQKLSEYDRIVAQDFQSEYPLTPREVLKWYNRIITEYYGHEDLTDSELKKLIERQRALLDTELLEQNPEDQFILNVKSNIVEYQARSQRIVQSKVCSSNDFRYKTVNGYECAYGKCYYFMKEGSNFFPQYQEYCLRKDTEGHWKILTWRVTTGEAEDFR